MMGKINELNEKNDWYNDYLNFKKRNFFGKLMYILNIY